MDDLQRPPADSDRERVAARIERVYDEGRIGAADRDIRLGNARSAQSMAELDLMSRDLDQLEATLPASAAPGPAQDAPWSAFDTRAAERFADSTVSGSPRRFAAVLAVFVALVLVVGAVVAVVGYSLSTSDGGSTDAPAAPTAPAPEEPGSSSETDAVPSYVLSRSGIPEFLAAYRQKFRTSKVVDLTLYEDYAIVNVPVPGKARQSGWLFRNGQGWTPFGGVRATFPGSAVVDTNRLDIDALVRNIARARRTLNVERPAQAYVIIRYIPRIEEVPSVDIHVTNRFQESGYLATTLDGAVERAFPYATR